MPVLTDAAYRLYQQHPSIPKKAQECVLDLLQKHFLTLLPFSIPNLQMIILRDNSTQNLCLGTGIPSIVPSGSKKTWRIIRMDYIDLHDCLCKSSDPPCDCMSGNLPYHCTNEKCYWYHDGFRPC